MKTSLHKHSFRTVGLALGLAVSLAAASHSAQAAIVQITLGSANGFKYSLTDQSANFTPLDVTLDGTPDSVYLYLNNQFEVGLFNTSNPTNPPTQEIAFVFNYGGGAAGANSSAKTFTFQDARINGGNPTTGYVQGVGVADSNNNVFSVTLTRVVFDNASTTAPTFTGSETGITEFGASSTAVPEPGTFIPAAVLVAGAILRRRRSRSHRSGRATA